MARTPGTKHPAILRATVTVLLVIAAGAWCSDKRDERVDWVGIEQEFTEAGFPARFTDSLKALRKVEYVPGLRRVPKGTYVSGEKLLYEVGWGPMKAGYGIISFDRNPQRPWYHLTAKGVTNNFVGAFFKVRDYLHCIVDTSGLYPFFFEEHIQEGRYRAKRWALYDHVQGRVYTERKSREEVEAPKFTNSILSLFYTLRSRRFSPGDTTTIDCLVQGRNYKVFFRCIRREEVEIQGRRIPCILVEPRLEGEGRVFTKKDKIRLWFTDDEHAVPVLIKSKIAVGSISVRLIGYRGPAPMPPEVESL